MLNYNLKTIYYLDSKKVLPEYPRPQFKRDSYFNLNGIWNLEILNKENKVIKKTDVVVPYPIESSLSNVRYDLEKGEYLVYSRDFNIKLNDLKDITLLHIDACDQLCTLYINDNLVDTHEGGYLPFISDITKYLIDGLNSIKLFVYDDLDYTYPTGKQSRKRGNIWYTPISGIWQTVWMETVSNDYIKNVKITPNIDNNTVTFIFDTSAENIYVDIYDNDNELVKSFNTTTKENIIEFKNYELWSPEKPYLYYVTFKTKNDLVKSYFAMRKFSVNDKCFLLNNKPYFINGLLDQGYFSDGIYTPSSYEAFKDDILFMKDLGFNSLRKHIKIEPMMYYYYCDLFGMIVLQDMVNVGKYNMFKDTILPFAGINKKLFVNVNNKQKEMFIKHTNDTIDYLYNVPCIGYYTIFNEGWGQFSGDKLYKIVTEVDHTRVIDATSGWFKEKLSDVESKHIYFKPIKLKKYNKPIIVSEFGGYTCKINNHSFNDSKTFGYKKFETIETFEKGFIDLYKNDILNNIKNNLAGCIYTQVSDVEDETNGILTYDRKICKLNKYLVRPLMEDIYKQFNEFNKNDN